MPARRILFLGSHQLSSFIWQNGNVRGDGAFPNTPEGVDAFNHYLTAHPNGVFTLLTNIAEEGFQPETIPFLQQRDRNAVIARKLGQYFYTTPYTTAVSLGYERTRRKDEKLLLAALTASSVLDPWISAIRDARVPLTGIFSQPFLSEALLKKLKIADERCILLTVQDQSIRQTYFENGRLHFSRLSPLLTSSIGGIAQGFASEAVKLQQYLLSQRLIARNQPLRAIVVAHPQAIPAIEASCISTDSLAYRVIGSDECSRLVGLRNAPNDSHIDTLLVHLAASAPGKAQFAKEALRHDYRIWQIRNALYGLAAATLLGCLLFVAKEMYSTVTLNGEAEAITRKAQETRLRYEDIKRTFPPIPTSNETLRQLIDRYAEFERGGGSTPEIFYREVSTALTRSPNIDLDLVTWRSGGSPTSGGTPPAGGQSGQLRGTIDLGPHATPRQTLAAFDQFIADLRNNPALEIKVVQQPFDIDSGKALKSSSETAVDNGRRPFALDISRKATP